LSPARRITLSAVFAALAFATMSVFRFNVQFLTFDLKDTIITISGLLLGPLTALTISLLTALLELITVSDTGWYGFLMNFASSATFSVVCAVVYRYNKKLWGAIVGLASAVVALVAVMLGLNLVVTPLYQGVPRSVVVDLIPTLFLPFNMVKGMANAALVLILYKPVHRAMQAARLLPKPHTPDTEGAGDPAKKKNRLLNSILILLGGLLILAAAVAVFYFVLDGHIEIFRS
jgi:riboflavin transporter FmnP